MNNLTPTEITTLFTTTLETLTRFINETNQRLATLENKFSHCRYVTEQRLERLEHLTEFLERKVDGK